MQIATYTRTQNGKVLTVTPHERHRPEQVAPRKFRRAQMPENLHFARTCREYRILKGISATRLATQIGIGRTILLALEQGRMAPTLAHAIRIAQALDLPLTAMLPEQVAPIQTL